MDVLVTDEEGEGERSGLAIDGCGQIIIGWKAPNPDLPSLLDYRILVRQYQVDAASLGGAIPLIAVQLAEQHTARVGSRILNNRTGVSSASVVIRQSDTVAPASSRHEEADREERERGGLWNRLDEHIDVAVTGGDDVGPTGEGLEQHLVVDRIG